MSAETGGEQSLWYKDAIIYELHVRAFADSNGDGIGDFRGLTERLDYLQDLGVTALWLLPFYPSPLRDDGYDIADYMNIHPAYGTMRDFRAFLREARRRGLKVITELVINHTSDQHPWFQRARHAPPASVWRDFYVWSDTPDKYSDARIIFKDFETSNWTWDPVAQAYFWHRFYHHQPDLNWENPRVHRAVMQVLDYWLEMGVDGLRLDAIPYLYEAEGTNCENLPRTHDALRELRQHVDHKFADRMLLAEANQWPEDSVAYFGNGDECHMAFHFPVMPRMYMALHMEDRYPMIDILSQTPPIPENSQWALFLRNHDELTLEMVTDEERDYMYRMYAHEPAMRINLGIRRRLAPLLGNNRRRIELLNGLLFSLPGTPVLYYGDEIGMGDNVYLGDRNGVRTPMQWSCDRNAGFSRANPQRLYLPIITDPQYHYEAINVEAQQSNPQSLLWWMKRLIAMRKRHPAFGRGTLEFLYPDNRKVLTFVRRHENESILVVANLSRFVQHAELNLPGDVGSVPVELFGRTEFPPITDGPYPLTLGPHTFYWFALEPRGVDLLSPGVGVGDVRVLTVAGDWRTIFQGRGRTQLQEALPAYIRGRRWYGGKARRAKSLTVEDTIPLSSDGATAMLTFVRVEYTEGDPDVYLLPVTYAGGEQAAQIEERSPQAVVARVTRQDSETSERGVLYDALWDDRFATALLETVARRRGFRGGAGEVSGAPTPVLRQARGSANLPLLPRVSGAEQSNTSVIFGDHLIMKLYRRLGEGVNPDLEIGRFLTEKAGFTHTPALAGALEYRQGQAEPRTLALLQRFVPNEGDAWEYTLDVLTRSLEDIAARQHEEMVAPGPLPSIHELARHELPPEAAEIAGSYLDWSRLLGQRTAEMHLALASDRRDPRFAPEPFSALYQRSIYQSMRGQANGALQLLRRRLHTLPEAARQEAERVLALEAEILGRLRRLIDYKIEAMRIRVHGDYHLGQVLFTGNDFVIIDFEGEPARTLSERRIKRSPLRDVAGMLRSFHYASRMALNRLEERGLAAESASVMGVWADAWHRWVSAAFLRAYLEATGEAGVLPRSAEQFKTLLDAYVLDKALYELAYELNNRPDWVGIPLQGLQEVVEEAPAGAPALA